MTTVVVDWQSTATARPLLCQVSRGRSPKRMWAIPQVTLTRSLVGPARRPLAYTWSERAVDRTTKYPWSGGNREPSSPVEAVSTGAAEARPVAEGVGRVAEEEVDAEGAADTAEAGACGGGSAGSALDVSWEVA